MKPLLKYLFILFVLLTCTHVQAQQYNGDQYVLGAAGGSSQASNYQIDWTVGEPVIELVQGSKKQLTQGFHQSKTSKSSYVFSRLDQDYLTHFKVFPNPFVTNFLVEWNFSENLNLIFEIFTLDGSRIFFKRQNAMDSQLHIQLSNLKPAMYILRISEPQRNFSETHKIVKI